LTVENEDIMKKHLDIIFWILFIIYMEFVFKSAIFGISIDINIFSTIIFSSFYALIIYSIINCFKGKINKILSYIFMSGIIFFFCAQLIYYKIYLSVFSMFSMARGGQVFQFWESIFKILFENIIYILILILPLIIYIVISKKIEYKRLNQKGFLLYVLLIVIFYFTSFLSVSYIDDGSAYNQRKLYFDIHSPTLSVSKFGLITTMRLDITRLIFGFKEKIDIVPVENNNEENIVEYNKLDIDFTSLIVDETDTDILNLHNYFNSAESTKKNEYTGIFEGKNLIYILAESFNTIAIDPILTPTLYKLSNEAFVFNNYYVPLYPVSTSDGEYMGLTSLIPKEGVWSSYWSSKDNYPFVYGNIFKTLGYKTTAYHNHTYDYYRRDLSHPNFGYDYYACGRGLVGVDCSVWPESDVELINATVDDYINDIPFHTYYITVSGHLGY
jgi:hypothetical protein